MAHPYHHALSSASKHGGRPEDYQPIHDWFDASKAYLPDFRHRALRHHAEGIFLCEQIFGLTLVTSAGRTIPVRWIGEQHVKEDLGWIPTAADWLRAIRPAAWMAKRSPLEPAIPTCGSDVLGATAGPGPHAMADVSRSIQPSTERREDLHGR